MTLSKTFAQLVCSWVFTLDASESPVMFDSVVGGGPAFAATPQGISLITQLMTADSRFKRDGLREVYDKARAHYESQQSERLASEQIEQNPAEGNPPMSLEQALEANTKAIEALTAALAGAKVSAPAAAPAAAAKTPAAKTPAKTEAKKPTHTAEEVAALAGTYREKVDTDQAAATAKTKAFIKETFGVDKLKELPAEKLDFAFDKLTEALAEIEAAGSAEEETL